MNRLARIAFCVAVLGLPLGSALADDMKPEGEIKSMAPNWGSEVPIPRLALGQANDYTQLLYDALVGVKADGSLSTETGLAEKWETSEDGLTWTFHIRKGVKFHNGEELTAKDVEFSIWQTVEPDSKSGYKKFIQDTIKSIDTPDPYTVVLHLSSPSIYLTRYFTGSLAMVIPKDYYEKVGLEGFIKNPIGSGPYKWHSQSTGSYLKLEAVDNHWLVGVPRFKYMTFLVVPEEATRAAMLQTGEGDITVVSRSRVKEIRDAGFNVLFKKGDALLNVRGELAWKAPAFMDVRFRKALDLAIDKDAIRKSIFGGMAEEAVSYPGRIVSTCTAVPELKPRPYDPDQARQLIKDAGLEGYEFFVPNINRSEVPELSQVVEALVGYWQAIGLKPKIRNTKWSAYRSQKRAGDVANHMVVIDNSAAESCKSILHELGGRFYSKYSKGANLKAEDFPEMAQMFEAALNATSDAEVQKQVAKIYQYAYDNWFSAVIAELDLPVAVSAKVPAWDLGAAKSGNNYRGLVTRQ